MWIGNALKIRIVYGIFPHNHRYPSQRELGGKFVTSLLYERNRLCFRYFYRPSPDYSDRMVSIYCKFLHITFFIIK